MRDVDALIISHDHSDHVRCAGVYHRKYGIPLYITRETYRATRRYTDLGKLSDVRHFRSGESLTFGRTVVHTLATAHDAVDGVAFVVEAGGTGSPGDGKRLGILTDLGHPFDGLREVLESVDAAYLECNYDPDMLECGSYPPTLKRRIRGPGGHLSNDDAAAVLRACGRNRPKWIAVAHLSEDNNHPELAIAAQHEAVGRQYPVHHASRYEASDCWTV